MNAKWVVTLTSGTIHEIDATPGQRIYFQDENGKRHFLGCVAVSPELVLRRSPLNFGELGLSE